MGLQYNVNKKALQDLPLTIVSGDITDTTQWYAEVGKIGAVSTQSGKILLSQFALVIDTVLDTNAIHKNVAGEILTVTEKVTPINADLILIEDSADANNKKRIQIGNLPGGSGGTSIENAATTTGLYTEETANRLVGHSTGTGTALIFEMFEGTGTPVSVFQVDGNGSLYNNGYNMIYKKNNCIYIGAYIHPTTITSGTNSVMFGVYAGKVISSGSNSVYIGQSSGQANLIGSQNTYIGMNSGYFTTGSGNVFVGYQAGRFQVAVSNKYIVNNQDRTNAAGDLTDSLIVGEFNATVANQWLQINANLKTFGIQRTINTITTDYSATLVDHIIEVDATSNTVYVELPECETTNDGKEYKIDVYNADNVVTVLSFTEIADAEDVNTITDQGGNTWRYSLNSNLTTGVVGDYVKIESATNAANNGIFVATGWSIPLDYIEVTNAAGVAEGTDSPATLKLHTMDTNLNVDDRKTYIGYNNRNSYKLW